MLIKSYSTELIGDGDKEKPEVDNDEDGVEVDEDGIEVDEEEDRMEADDGEEESDADEAQDLVIKFLLFALFFLFIISPQQIKCLFFTDILSCIVYLSVMLSL